MELKISDPVWVKPERYNFFQKFLVGLINDPRDLPFVYLCLKMTFIVIPFSVLMFVPGVYRWWIAVPFLVLNIAWWLGPFVLMMHNTSHRPLFKKRYRLLNHYIPWVLGPFYGETPETYFGHHIVMHHVENNLPEDLSCTMNYRRDSIRSFAIYFFLFFAFGITDLSYYFKRKEKWNFLKKILLGELGFIAMCILLWRINPAATLTTFVIPFVVARFGMMSGNWAQHAFVDASDPSNNFKNAITCINTSYNRRCFNDGYHIGHHLRATLHWLDMPTDFQRNIEKYRENESVVFDGLEYLQIWFFLMTKNYRKLAGHVVDLGEKLRTQDETIAFLKQRLAAIPIQRMSLNANVVFNAIR